MHSFAETGGEASYKEGMFPALLTALYQSDVGSHPHPQVILNYFKCAERYITPQTPEDGVTCVVQCMLGPSGLRNPSEHVRYHSAYLFRKVVKSLEGRAAALLPVVGSFSGMSSTPITLFLALPNRIVPYPTLPYSHFLIFTPSIERYS